MLAGGTAIFLGVMALLAVSFRRGGGGGASERLWIAGLGLAFPAAVLLGLLAWGLTVGERHLVAGRDAVPVFRAEARQWAWTFHYPGTGLPPTEGLLLIPAGRPVEVEITARDVIHSFWVPQLAGKLDAIPGRVNRLRLEADGPGDFAGLGAEFNGTGYRDHGFTLRALAPADWDALLADGAP